MSPALVGGFFTTSTTWEAQGEKKKKKTNCTWIFIEALFIIVKTWKKPRSPSLVEQINCGISRQWNIIQNQKNKELQSPKKT